MDRYNQIDYGYAATIHKAQGVTVDRSYVLASRFLDAHSTYVAMSRHRESADLFYSKDVFLTKGDLFRTLSRERIKDVTLDYLDNKKIFAEARGVHGQDEIKSGLSKALHQDQVLSDDKERLMRQEKLKAFTENAMEKMRAKGNRIELPTRERALAELNEFKRQFEAKHPNMAISLKKELVPEYVSKATELMREFKRLEDIIDEGGRSSSMAKDHIERLADKMSRQKDIMQYVKEHSPSMEKQVRQLAKEFQKERDLGLEL